MLGIHQMAERWNRHMEELYLADRDVILCVLLYVAHIYYLTSPSLQKKSDCVDLLAITTNIAQYISGINQRENARLEPNPPHGISRLEGQRLRLFWLQKR